MLKLLTGHVDADKAIAEQPEVVMGREPVLKRRSSGSLLEEEALTASQWADRHRQRLTPEQRLCLAVLEDARLIFQKHAHRPLGAIHHKTGFAEVEAWLAADDWGWPFSFVSVCQALGLEPSYVRRGFAEWKANPGSVVIRHSRNAGDGGRKVVPIGEARA